MRRPGVGTTLTSGEAAAGHSAYEPKPSWQTTYGSINGGVLGATTKRTGPDISLLADPITGVYIYDPANGGWEAGVGGTSLSSPLFAGLIADADGMRRPRATPRWPEHKP